MSKHILVVENDPMSRELARRVLVSGGFDVTCATSGEEALRLAGRLKPDLVLCDLGLPGIDGIEVTQRLLARKATAGAKVAVLSARAFPEDVERAHAAGAAGYLTKPIGAGELLARVAELLGVAPRRRRSLTSTTPSARRTR